MKNILVTGAAGFIGSHFVDYSLAKGDKVVAVDNLSYGKRQNVDAKAKFVEVDVTDYEAIREILVSMPFDVVVHFAADATTKTSAMGWNDPMRDYRVNMVGTLNLLEIIRRHSIGAHFVYASSAAVYGEPVSIPIVEAHPTNPVSPYGISKLSGEKYCQAYGKEWGIRTTAFRIFNTFGPRQPRYVMYDQIKQMLTDPSKVVVLGTGAQVRDYAYVSDVVAAFYMSIDNPKVLGEVYNVAGGNKTTIRDLIEVISRAVGAKVQATYTGQSWKGDIQQLWADTTKVRNLGWEPSVSLDEGVKRLVAWMRETPHE